MKVHIGLKSDPVEYRYSYEWLFDRMRELGLRHLQLGGFFELFSLEDGYFRDLREQAERRGVRILSCFTAHRELGGFLFGDPYMERVTRRSYERLIQVGALLGAESVGGSAGAVYRDRLAEKPAGIARYLRHMRELMPLARRAGLKALTLEPMSCLAEPPTLPEELEQMLGPLAEHHRLHPDTTVPVQACADIAHGYADGEGRVVHDNWSLFELAVPWMREFHIKNTDSRFEATFGFSPEERRRGIVDLRRLKELIDRCSGRFPVTEIVGYLELSGPKWGRDYTDSRLERMIGESVEAIQEVFAPEA